MTLQAYHEHNYIEQIIHYMQKIIRGNKPQIVVVLGWWYVDAYMFPSFCFSVFLKPSAGNLQKDLFTLKIGKPRQVRGTQSLESPAYHLLIVGPEPTCNFLGLNFLIHILEIITSTIQVSFCFHFHQRMIAKCSALPCLAYSKCLKDVRLEKLMFMH